MLKLEIADRRLGVYGCMSDGEERQGFFDFATITFDKEYVLVKRKQLNELLRELAKLKRKKGA